jgi:hypothetical protein
MRYENGRLPRLFYYDAPNTLVRNITDKTQYVYQILILSFTLNTMNKLTDGGRRPLLYLSVKFGLPYKDDKTY